MANTTIQVQRGQSDPATVSKRDAIALLEPDHRAVEKLFVASEQTGNDDLHAKGTLVRRACEELTVHAMIGEALLYPAAHGALSAIHRRKSTRPTWSISS